MERTRGDKVLLQLEGLERKDGSQKNPERLGETLPVVICLCFSGSLSGGVNLR